MAPEQLDGGQIDARTDMFSFGSVLFEMLTGRKAFEGANRSSLILGILGHEPAAISTLRPSVSGWLEDVVKRCLAKNPGERWPIGARRDAGTAGSR